MKHKKKNALSLPIILTTVVIGITVILLNSSLETPKPTSVAFVPTPSMSAKYSELAQDIQKKLDSMFTSPNQLTDDAPSTNVDLYFSVHKALYAMGVHHIQIWSKKHMILFTQEANSAGKVEEDNMLVSRALDGTIDAQLMPSSASGEMRFYDALYIPIRIQGKGDPEGVVEAFMPK